MTAPARPDRTYAVVVGVEQYAAGHTWDLSGPAADARRFTSWLRGHGVPAANIFLLLSALPDARGPQVDVASGAAGRESVQEVLTRRLPALEGDLLWVFWGGHGVTDPDRGRRLFYADAVQGDQRNLDLDASLNAFTTDRLPGFPRQIWLIDSCQTFADDLGIIPSLPSERPPGGRPLPGRKQFALLASGPGQRALNDPGEQTGAFSRAVLAALGRESWPPDMDAVAEVVLGQFEEGGQRPTSLLYRSWGGSETRREFAPPRRRPGHPPGRLPQPALRELVDLLEDLPHMTDQDQRGLIVELLPRNLAGSIRRHAAPRPDILGIVLGCDSRPGGLVSLLEAVGAVDPGTRDQGGPLTEWESRWLRSDDDL
ncbi:effector-associated domain 2-containing protein [Actinacidiphila sp. ITFR-21]|uniref:effector-associated domain 2-containing protein n=1 Tax=Actinacidiphila sp. ITFR-21 TaxID=3075199 RepID=UPI00288ACE73|nr:caspase family protein [Streptomyces sp. ITFR-21]WNI16431.1 caspase family protein [Streptomyces sp. ITFR-21]